MKPPLVSVVTPTIPSRHELLLNRCIPSVQAQTYRNVEHVIVSDCPDPELEAALKRWVHGSIFTHPVLYTQLPGPHPGHRYGGAARRKGIEMAQGGLIAYIDDDDALRPEHVSKLAAALNDDPALMWAFSVMASHSNTGLYTHIGDYAGPPQACMIGTPMLMHRREILRYGTWGEPSQTEDWELVKKWLDAGLPYGRVHEPTVDVYPSAYWG